MALLCLGLAACGGSSQYDYQPETSENVAIIYQYSASVSKEVDDGMVGGALGLPSRQIGVLISELNGVNVKPRIGFISKADYKTLKLPQGHVQLKIDITTVDPDTGYLSRTFPMEFTVDSVGIYQLNTSADDPLHYKVWIEDETGSVKKALNVSKQRKKGLLNKLFN